MNQENDDGKVTNITNEQGITVYKNDERKLTDGEYDEEEKTD